MRACLQRVFGSAGVCVGGGGGGVVAAAVANSEIAIAVGV